MACSTSWLPAAKSTRCVRWASQPNHWPVPLAMATSRASLLVVLAPI